MALACISYEESDGINRQFKIDLGRNRYYAYAVGSKDSILHNGIALLGNPSYESPVIGPIDSDDGRSELAVPESRFDREHRFIQLQSFRTREREGPAVSLIQETETGEGDDRGERRLSMGRSFAMSTPALSLRIQGPQPVLKPRRRRCRISESKSLSTAQFIDALISLLPQLLPATSGLVGALVGGASPASGGGGAAVGAPQWMGQLTTLLQQLLSQSSRPIVQPAAASSAPGTSAVQAASISIAQAQFSHAMIAPALIAALPALMPLLQQVLSPQTIQSVLQTADPNRLIGTISNAINSFAQLGMQNSEAERAHLRALNPGVDDPALMALLGQMSTNLERVHINGPTYRRTSQATLHFAGTGTVTLGGKQVTTYIADGGLRFPLVLETVRPVPPGMMRACILHADTLDTVASFRVRTPPLSEGRLSIVPEFKAEDLHSLQSGHDYLVKTELMWKNKSGQRIGTTTTQTIRIIGHYTFDGVREGKQIVPLNDIDKFREYWHKIWQDSFSKEVARREYECKYYYVLKPDLISNEQAQTDILEDRKGIRKVTGRMKAGLLLSPNRLNELLPQISSQAPLSEAELKALLDPRFIDRLSLAARFHAKFSGPPERPAALWVFPEVKLQRVVLRHADKVDNSGLVLSLAEHEVIFPMPVLVHFIGLEAE